MTLKIDKKLITYEDVKNETQASDLELDVALKEMRILRLKQDVLRPISQSYLNSVLELLLNAIVSMTLSPDAVPVIDIVETLQSEHEVQRDVLLQVLPWFGELDGEVSGRWKMDQRAVVRQLGIGILSDHRVRYFLFLFSSAAFIITYTDQSSRRDGLC